MTPDPCPGPNTQIEKRQGALTGQSEQDVDPATPQTQSALTLDLVANVTLPL